MVDFDVWNAGYDKEVEQIQERLMKLSDDDFMKARESLHRKRSKSRSPRKKTDGLFRYLNKSDSQTIEAMMHEAHRALYGC